MLPESETPDTLRSFHCDLRAALLAGVPISFDGSRSFGLAPRVTTVAEVDRLERQLGERLKTQTSLSAALSDRAAFPAGYRAAVLVNASTSTMSVVLEGLSTRRLARRRLAKLIRPAAIYLSLVLGVAALGLMFFSDFIFPTVQFLRNDLQWLPAIDAPSRFDATVVRRFYAAGLAILASLLLLAWLSGGTARIVSLLGGRRYQTLRAAAPAIRAAGLLRSKGVTGETATDWACDLVGDDRSVRAIVHAVIPIGDGGTVKEDPLSAQAAHLYQLAAHRLSMLSLMLPSLLVLGIGGAVVLSYGLLILWPIFALFKDLSLPAI